MFQDQPAPMDSELKAPRVPGPKGPTFHGPSSLKARFMTPRPERLWHAWFLNVEVSVWSTQVLCRYFQIVSSRKDRGERHRPMSRKYVTVGFTLRYRNRYG